MAKLIKLRGAQQADFGIDSATNLNKLNEICQDIEKRTASYESQMKGLKSKKNLN